MRRNPSMQNRTILIQCDRALNLLCRKPEIESLGFTCNWLVLVGRLAWTRATCTYFRVADKFTTAKWKAGTLYQILQDTQLSFGCCVGLAQLKETPAHRTAASLWLRSNLQRCTSEPIPHLHAPPDMFIEVTSATLRAHPKQALSTARQQGRGVLEPLYTTSASSRWSRPRSICSACLSHWHLPWRSPPFIRLGPKPTQKCWQQWPTDELAPSWKCLLPQVKAKDDGACLRLAHAQVENEIPARPRRAPRRGAARRECRGLRAFPIWGIHIQTKSTFICGINGVGGGGGGGSCLKHFMGSLSRKQCSISMGKYSPVQWNWFLVVSGCIWVTCISDVREPISLHQAVEQVYTHRQCRSFNPQHSINTSTYVHTLQRHTSHGPRPDHCCPCARVFPLTRHDDPRTTVNWPVQREKRHEVQQW